MNCRTKLAGWPAGTKAKTAASANKSAVGTAHSLFAVTGEQCLEDALVSRARKQLIPIDQVEKRHRLPAQRMDDMTVVDHMTVLVTVSRRSATPQRKDLRGAEKALEPVIVETHIEVVADQLRGPVSRSAARKPSAANGGR
jgi:hypothetical protein